MTQQEWKNWAASTNPDALLGAGELGKKYNLGANATGNSSMMNFGPQGIPVARFEELAAQGKFGPMTTTSGNTTTAWRPAGSGSSHSLSPDVLAKMWR
jgi:hypothetical protein